MTSLYITNYRLSEQRDETDNRILLIWGHTINQFGMHRIEGEPLTEHYIEADSIFMCENINRPDRQHSRDPHRSFPGEHWIVEHVSFPNE